MSLHVAITGASSGIGEALVRAYVAAGAAVTLVARRRERMEAIAAEAGGRTQIFPRDLSDPDNCCDWLEPATAGLGPIDVLVNNAAVQIIGPTVEVPDEDVEWLLRLNVFSPFRLTRAVLPAMLERQSGTIVNVASLAALAPTPGMIAYNASKGALAGASESLRSELRGTGVNVLTVYPGPVQTAMADNAYDNLEETAGARWAPVGDADVLARRIVKAVRKGRSRIIYPRIYGVSRHFPNLSRWLINRFAPKAKSTSATGRDSPETVDR